jgi:nucleoside-diphosphate-sugar epimerase
MSESQEEMAPSVLLIGAGGWLGVYLVKEFIGQKDKFGRVAILASDESKRSRFTEAEKSGIDVVVGSLLDVHSYKGEALAMAVTRSVPATARNVAKRF